MKRGEKRVGTEQVGAVLCGIGGYGRMYLQALLQGGAGTKVELAGVVDPFAATADGYPELHERKIPVYGTLEDFYKQQRADLAVVCSPIHWHCRQTLLALTQHSHVLCEKPAAATVQEVESMMTARDRAGRQVAVGYQWSFSSAIQALKRDIAAGLFGRPLRLSSLHLWPRDQAYYDRNDWAGRQRDGKGNWILDSPASNACAHELHNMFYLLGGAADRSAVPREVTAELYRAYAIENFDTAACRAFTTAGTEILFYVSHASAKKRGPCFLFQFEKAEVRLDEQYRQLTALCADGSQKTYGHFDDDPQEQKLWNFIQDIQAGREAACGLEAAFSQVLCVNGLQESQPEIVPFPAGLIQEMKEGESRRLWVKGLQEALEQSFAEGRLPGELGFFWSLPGRRVNLSEYHRFPKEVS